MTDDGVLEALLEAITVERMVDDVACLAGDSFGGRRVGTDGSAAARAWLIERLQGVSSTVHTEPFTVPAVRALYGPPALEVEGYTGPLRYRRDFIVHPASADQLANLRAPVSADWDGATGNWLLLDPSADVHAAAHRAAELGAVGLIVQRVTDAEGWMPAALAGPPSGPLPILAVTPALHARLCEGRRVVEANTPLRTAPANGVNLHARISAPAPDAPDVLLTAHYDGVGDDPGLRLPGAADNASGVAVVCEAALVLCGKLPDGAGLSVALLDAEEVGAAGSAHHAHQVSDQGSRPWVLNVDGAGHLDGAVAAEAGGPAHGLLHALDQAGRRTGVPLRAGPVASDNRRYAGAGLPAVGLGAGMLGYHGPGDTADRVAPDTLRAMARLVTATVWQLTNGAT